MSVIECLLRGTIYAMVIFLLGILICDMGDQKKADADIAEIAAAEPKPIEMLQVLPEKVGAHLLTPLTEKQETYRERIKRFDIFRSKVLLKEGEAMEKQRLLAHTKTIHWIESNLSEVPSNGTGALGERLDMIDFLEEALAWKENPIRSDVLDSIERTLKVNNLGTPTKEVKQMLAGDKIELFAILSAEAPNRAKALLETTKDSQLVKVFQYAIKRLALKSLSEVTQ